MLCFLNTGLEAWVQKVPAALILSSPYKAAKEDKLV